MDPNKNLFNTNPSDKDNTNNPFQNIHPLNLNQKNSLQPITQTDQFLLDDLQTQQKRPKINHTNYKPSDYFFSNQYSLNGKKQNYQRSNIFQNSSQKSQSNQKNINPFSSTSSKSVKQIQYPNYSQNIKQLDDEFQMLIALNQNKSAIKQSKSYQNNVVPQKRDMIQKQKKNQQRFQRLSIQIGRKSGQFFKQSVARRKTIGPSLSINQTSKNQNSQAKNQQKKIISNELPKQIVSLQKLNIPIQKMELQNPKQQKAPFFGAFAPNTKTPTKQSDEPIKVIQSSKQTDLNKTPTNLRPASNQNSKSKICKQRMSMKMDDFIKYLEGRQQQRQSNDQKKIKKQRLTLALEDLTQILTVQNQKEERIKLMSTKKQNNMDSKQVSMKKKNDNPIQLQKKEQMKNSAKENKDIQQKDKKGAFLQYQDRNGVIHQIYSLQDSQENVQQSDLIQLTPLQMQKEVFQYFRETFGQELPQQQSQYENFLQKKSDMIDELIQKSLMPHRQQINPQKQMFKKYQQQINQLNQEKNQIEKKLLHLNDKYTKQKAQLFNKKLSSFQSYLGMKIIKYTEDKQENKNGININKANRANFQGFYSVVIYKNMFLKFKRAENTQFALLKISSLQTQVSKNQTSNFTFSQEIKVKLIQKYVQTKLEGAKTFIQVLIKLGKYCKILTEFQISLQILFESFESNQIELSSDGLKLNMKFNWNYVQNNFRRSASSSDANSSQFELTVDLLSLLQDGGITVHNNRQGSIALPEQYTRFSQKQSKLARVFNFINSMVINQTENKIQTKIEELNMFG